jgi:hypothetical protein
MPSDDMKFEATANMAGTNLPGWQCCHNGIYGVVCEKLYNLLWRKQGMTSKF